MKGRFFAKIFPLEDRVREGLKGFNNRRYLSPARVGF